MSESHSETIKWINEVSVIFLSQPQEQSHISGCSVVVVVTLSKRKIIRLIELKKSIIKMS